MPRSWISRLPQEAKIFIVIVALIAVPSLVLTSLATLVIGQERERIEQQVRRTALATVGGVADRIEGLMAGVEGSVRSLCQDRSVINGPIDQVAQLLEFARQNNPALASFDYFLLDELGNRRLSFDRSSPAPLDPRPFVGLPPDATILRQALLEESRDKDYLKAANTYHAVAESAGDNEELRIAGLNGEARCRLNLKDYERAKELYAALLGSSFLRDFSRLQMGFVARYQIGRILKLQGQEEAYADQRLSFLRWLQSPQTVDLTDPAQRQFYEELVRQELRTLFRSEPDRLQGRRAEFEQIDREYQLHRALFKWLVAMVEPRVLADLRAGSLGPRGPVFLERAVGVGEPAVICYGLARRPGESTPLWAVGYVLNSKALRDKLDLSNESELRRLDRQNLRLQIRDSAGNLLWGDERSGDQTCAEERLRPPYPAWQVRIVAAGSIDATSVLRSRTALLIGLVSVSVLVLGLGIFVTIWTSGREIRTARLRSDFVAAVTHDLKTPLTAIRMFAETLQMGRYRNEEEFRCYIDGISQETERLTRLIDRVLNFARMERGQRVYHFERVEATDLVQDALASVSQLLQQDRFEVKVDLADDLPSVKADPDAIVEVLVNLLGNAIKYSPVEKRLRVQARAGSGKVWISVTDHGIGISPRDQRRVFEKFYRADDPVVKEAEGTGLGLTVSRSIARAHGGDLEVQSEPGRGSTFTLVLPAAGEHP